MNAVRPEGVRYIQGYLCIDETKVIRVRVAGELGFLTIKGGKGLLSHPEFEYGIPREEAMELIRQFAKNTVEKVRTRISHKGHLWEVDDFMGENEGLLIAEIELESPDEAFENPAWLGEEVTGDKRYYNSWLSLNPFRSWHKKTPEQ